jgi:hypothetical protein
VNKELDLDQITTLNALAPVYATAMLEAAVVCFTN